MKQKIMAIILCCSFVFLNLTPIQSYALDTNININSMEEYNLIDTAKFLIPYQENLEKTLGVECSIIILEDTPNKQTVKFIEGDKVDVVTYNISTDEIFVNGSLVTYEEMIVNSGISTTGITDPVTEFQGCIQLEKAIYQYTVSALCTLLDAIADVTQNVAWAFASSLITLCASAGYMYSDACYLHQYRVVDSSYSFYTRYWDMYWTGSYSAADLCDSYSQSFYYSRAIIS